MTNGALEIFRARLSQQSGSFGRQAKDYALIRRPGECGLSCDHVCASSRAGARIITPGSRSNMRVTVCLEKPVGSATSPTVYTSFIRNPNRGLPKRPKHPQKCGPFKSAERGPSLLARLRVVPKPVSGRGQQGQTLNLRYIATTIQTLVTPCSYSSQIEARGGVNYHRGSWQHCR